MASKKSARDRLLTEYFKGQYEGTLPTADKEMFAFATGMCIVKFSRKFYSMAMMDTEKDGIEGRIARRSAKIVYDLIYGLEKGIQDYICEVKGFYGKDKLKQYMEWFREKMSEFSAKEEGFKNMSLKRSEEIWEVIDKIMTLELERKMKEVAAKNWKV